MESCNKDKEYVENMYRAWIIICNSGGFDNPENASPGWVEAANKFRDDFHELLSTRTTGAP